MRTVGFFANQIYLIMENYLVKSLFITLPKNGVNRKILYGLAKFSRFINKRQ